MEVADRVHRLHDGIVNFYLVEDGGRLTLIDAGGTRHWTCRSHAWIEGHRHHVRVRPNRGVRRSRGSL